MEQRGAAAVRPFSLEGHEELEDPGDAIKLPYPILLSDEEQTKQNKRILAKLETKLAERQGKTPINRADTNDSWFGEIARFLEEDEGHRRNPASMVHWHGVLKTYFTWRKEHTTVRWPPPYTEMMAWLKSGHKAPREKGDTDSRLQMTRGLHWQKIWNLMLDHRDTL